MGGRLKSSHRQRNTHRETQMTFAILVTFAMFAPIAAAVVANVATVRVAV